MSDRPTYRDCGKCPYLGGCTHCEHPELLGPTMSDGIDIAALRELLAKATPGPWDWDGDGPAAVFALDADGAQDAHVADSSPLDAALICAARNAVPGLLDRIEALERSVEFYRNAADQQDMAVAAKQERIASLEAALREADPHNAMLPPEGADHG